MRIERSQTVGQQEAIRRIDTSLDELMQRHLPHPAIKNPSKSWSANTMSCSAKLKKSPFVPISSGSIRVTDRSVIVDSDLPRLVTMFGLRTALSERYEKARSQIFNHPASSVARNICLFVIDLDLRTVLKTKNKECLNLFLAQLESDVEIHSISGPWPAERTIEVNAR